MIPLASAEFPRVNQRGTIGQVIIARGPPQRTEDQKPTFPLRVGAQTLHARGRLTTPRRTKHEYRRSCELPVPRTVGVPQDELRTVSNYSPILEFQH